MSGVLCAATVMGAAPVPPLTCTITLTASTCTDNVSGSSGDLYIWSGGTHLVGVSISGGSGNWTMANIAFVSDGNTGGSSASMGLSADMSHQTIFWNAPSVGNTMLYHLTFDVADDIGNTASARWPSAGSAVIQRTS